MSLKVILVDVNPKMVEAWKSTFEENLEVEVVQGSLLDQKVSAWVSPTNSRGHMGGGVERCCRVRLQHTGNRADGQRNYRTVCKRTRQTMVAGQAVGGHVQVVRRVPTGGHTVGERA